MVLFVIDKISFLNLSFFWDEAWVYGNAITEFINTKIPLLPEPSSIDLTRGHPMFFHISASVWGKIFGDSMISLHSFPLFICIGFFVYLSRQKNVFLPSQIFTITLLLVGNEIFFTQSSLLLPEVMLGVFLFLAFYFAVMERWILYIAFFAMALYTKESAVVLFPVIISLLIYNRIAQGDKYGVLKIAALSIIPLFLASLHFIYQKSIFGWYFYPLHIDFIQFDFLEVASKFSRFYRAVFDARLQYFFNATFIIYVCLILHFQNAKRKVHIIVCIIGSFILMLAFNSRHNSIVISGSLLILSLGIGLYNIKYDSEVHRKIVLGSWLFIFGFIIFSALNFYSTRYIIPVIVFYAFAYTIILHKFIKLKSRSTYKYLIVIFLFLIAGRFQKNELSDIDTSYKSIVLTHSEITNYFVNNVDSDKKIGADFLENYMLENSNCRYLTEDQTFSNVSELHMKDQDYYIITNLEAPIEEKRKTIDMSSYEMIAQIVNSKSIGEIYKRR